MNRTFRIIKQRFGYLAGLAIALVIGGASTAAVLAAVPDTNSVIHTCYKTGTTGLLGTSIFRVIDTATTPNCANGETALTWNQQGPKGDKGDPGATGPQGPAGSGSSWANLVGADLSNADLRYRSFANLNVSTANFTQAQLTGVSFNGATLAGSTFSGNDPANSGFQILRADFRNTTLPSNIFHNIEFSFSDLSNTNLSNQTFYGYQTSNSAVFYASKLINANLTNTHFINNNLLATDLTGANLAGTTWQNTYCPDATNSDDDGGTCLGHFALYPNP